MFLFLMVTSVELIRAAREGTLDLDVYASASLTGNHIAAILATELARNPEGFEDFRNALTTKKAYAGFLSGDRPTHAVVDSTVRRLLDKKREGRSLAGDDSFNNFLSSYATASGPLRDAVGDGHMASFLATVMMYPLDVAETLALTQLTTDSGSTFDFSSLREEGYVLGDKHSTGGIGDGISLVLAPLVASVISYLKIPMMSGRGLGHTGGTLDKLESIGVNVGMDEGAVLEQLREVGFAIFGQTPQIAPLDKKMYGMRDAVDAVPDIGLICASIMGKKLAENLDALVLDVKTGNGAFFSELAAAVEYSKLASQVGAGAGVHTSAIITDMNQPLGRYAGNRLEIIETIELLSRHRRDSRYMQVALVLAAELASQAAAAHGTEAVDAHVLYDAGIRDHSAALDAFRRMVEAQGGDRDYVDHVAARYGDDCSSLYDELRHLSGQHRVDELKRALGYDGDLHVTPVVAERDGYLSGVAVEPLGQSIKALGAGRYSPSDTVDDEVGFVTFAELGDGVREGDELGIVVHKDKGNPDVFRNHFTISDTIVAPPRTVVNTYHHAAQ